MEGSLLNYACTSIVSASFAEKNISSPLHCFCIFVENQLAMYLWIYSGSHCLEYEIFLISLVMG